VVQQHAYLHRQVFQKIGATGYARMGWPDGMGLLLSSAKCLMRSMASPRSPSMFLLSTSKIFLFTKLIIDQSVDLRVLFALQRRAQSIEALALGSIPLSHPITAYATPLGTLRYDDCPDCGNPIAHDAKSREHSSKRTFTSPSSSQAFRVLPLASATRDKP
jgi:hypothetical protein